MTEARIRGYGNDTIFIDWLSSEYSGNKKSRAIYAREVVARHGGLAGYIACNDGTLLSASLHYDDWKFNVIRKGPFVFEVTTRNIQSKQSGKNAFRVHQFTDIVTLRGDIGWIIFGTDLDLFEKEDAADDHDTDEHQPYFSLKAAMAADLARERLATPLAELENESFEALEATPVIPTLAPWLNPPLCDWDISCINHYRIGRDDTTRRIFISMAKDGRYIKAEGPESAMDDLWQSLAKQATEVAINAMENGY